MKTSGVWPACLFGLFGLFVAGCTAEPESDTVDGEGDARLEAGPTVLGTPGENCPGYENPTGGDGLCRTDEECRAGGTCDVWPQTYSGVPPDDDLSTIPPPIDECAVDADCMTNRCEVVTQGPTDERVMQCVAACPDNPCAADQDCVEGACIAKACGADFACPDGFDCAPGIDAGDRTPCLPNDPNAGVQTRAADAQYQVCVEALTHGCVPRRCDAGYTCPLMHDCRPEAPGLGCVPQTCADDADCGCGFCVVAPQCTTNPDGSFSCDRVQICQPTLSGCTVFLP